MRRKNSIILAFFLLFAYLAVPIQAEQFQTKYSSTYSLEQNGDAQVVLHVSILRETAHTYVSQFSLRLPNEFNFENVHAKDSHGLLQTSFEKKDKSRIVTVLFNSQDSGQNLETGFDVMFTQKKLFTNYGNVWEIVLPVIQDDKVTENIVTVLLPGSNDKKISLSKPTPSSVDDNKISWANPKTRTIYVVFGSKQYYKLNLAYHLKNARFGAGFYDVAFPPDTAYQKIYIDSISPAPELTYMDRDGNYMGRFSVPSRSELNVIFKGYVTVYTIPQDDYGAIAKIIFNLQHDDYLTPKKYWSVDGVRFVKKNSDFTNVSHIYSFVTQKLQYDYSRVKQKMERMGAREALVNPTKAVCMEFTDTFIALSRANGIPARENEGFGFTDDSSLRPLSLVSDVLHSWPEYYDRTKNIWIQVDPTWENTSGIDYFNSFDLNHITFAIHGHDSELPLPAGTYKTNDSKDVIIELAQTIPKEHVTVEIADTIREKLYAHQKYSGTVELQNTGNVFIKSSHLVLKSNSITFWPKDIAIDELAPLEKRTFHFTYQAPSVNKKTEVTMLFLLNNTEIQSKNITVSPLQYLTILLMVIGTSVLLGIIIAIIITMRKKRS